MALDGVKYFKTFAILHNTFIQHKKDFVEDDENKCSLLWFCVISTNKRSA